MIRWNYFLKIVYRVSTFLLLFLPGLWILWRFIPLQFASNSIKDDWNKVLGFIFLGAILGTLAGTLKRTNHPALIVGKILLTLFIVFGHFILLVALSLAGGMCGWYQEKVLFVKKSNSNITIVTREFGCGATDSGPPVIRTVKKKKITPFFIQVTAIDTSTIDKEQWIPVEQANNSF